MSRFLDPSEISRYAPGNLGLDWLGQQMARQRAIGSQSTDAADSQPDSMATTSPVARPPRDASHTVRQMMLDICDSSVDVLELPPSARRRQA